MAFSSIFETRGFPRGFVIPIPWTILFAPIAFAVGIRAVINTVGIPALSISFSSTAPQRVPVPQVEVRITPETLAARSSSPMPRPMFFAFAMVVATPVVT
jgi:hypothetical protein